MKSIVYFGLGVCIVGNTNGLSLAGMEAITSSLPENLTKSMRCPDLPKDNSTRLGCLIMNWGDLLFGSVDATADLSDRSPSVTNRLYDPAGMAQSVRDGCFSLTALNGDVSPDQYSYSSLSEYKSTVESRSSFSGSMEVSYFLSSMSSSYNHAQTNENQVNKKFSYAKAHAGREIQMAKIKNTCMGTSMSKYMNTASLKLWEDLKENSDDPDVLRAFNSHFRALQPNEWIIGGISWVELTSTISSKSTFDSDAMSRGITAAAGVKFGGFGASASVEMTKAFENQTSKSGMTIITTVQEDNVWPCESGPNLLTLERSSKQYSQEKNACLDEFVNNFESWTPYKTSGYTSSLGVLMQPVDLRNHPGLEKKVAKALYDQTVTCHPVRVRGFRISRISTTPTGKSFTYNLASCNPYCRFEQGSHSLVFERVSGQRGKSSYLVHNVTDPNYNYTSRIALQVAPDGRLYTNYFVPEYRSNNQNAFGYNESREAFTFTSWGTPLKTYPNPLKYVDETGLGGYQYFLDSDARFIGTNLTDPEELNQHTFLLHVNGIRSAMTEQRIELCEPKPNQIQEEGGDASNNDQGSPSNDGGNTGDGNDGQDNPSSDDGNTGGTGDGNDGQGNPSSDDGNTGGTGDGNDGQGNPSKDDGNTGGTGDGNDGQGNPSSDDGNTGGTGDDNDGQGNPSSDDGNTGGTGDGNDGQGNPSNDDGNTGGTGDGNDAKAAQAVTGAGDSPGSCSSI
eukprot:CAMPEP_0203748870 /NCGR_PEP_ID=MMETSP0098-20131031/3632_1 /ASSEMBLY_ACC=CAM_ASM_000208 /TAXON_ID=96639 /ORGANISM=" , Strain NY0313808BC1" /LENGTH=733 /DNA_ID=CAMNT_0050637765 /DNA_START=2273 /DNA_END=4472 /DNA_ORIENTATION=-